MKSILVSEEIHTNLKEFSKETGISIKFLVEKAILDYLDKDNTSVKKNSKAGK